MLESVRGSMGALLGAWVRGCVWLRVVTCGCVHGCTRAARARTACARVCARVGACVSAQMRQCARARARLRKSAQTQRELVIKVVPRFGDQLADVRSEVRAAAISHLPALR